MLSTSVEVCSPLDTELTPAVDACRVDDPQWLNFLGSQPDATVFHHPSWSTLLADTYGHRAFVLVQRRSDGDIVAGLPVLQMRGLFQGGCFRALPFTDHCPPLARSAASLRAFTDNLARWRAAQGLGRLVVHGELASAPSVHPISRGVRHVLPLDRSSDQVLERLKGGPVPRAIRKAQRQGVRTSISRSIADLPTFYRLHLQTRRRLGAPIQPKRFIEALWHEVLGAGLGFVVIAAYLGQPVAAGLFLAWNRNLIYKFGASDTRYWELRPNNLVMWTAIDWACRHGYRVLDFGLTSYHNQGLRDFKKRWGSLEIPLEYSYVGDPPTGSRSRATQRALARVIKASPPIVCRLMGEVLYRHVWPTSAS